MNFWRYFRDDFLNSKPNSISRPLPAGTSFNIGLSCHPFFSASLMNCLGVMAGLCYLPIAWSLHSGERHIFVEPTVSAVSLWRRLTARRGR